MASCCDVEFLQASGLSRQDSEMTLQAGIQSHKMPHVVVFPVPSRFTGPTMGLQLRQPAPQI